MGLQRPFQPDAVLSSRTKETTPSAVMPANAGIQSGTHDPLDSPLRGNDKTKFGAVWKHVGHSRRRDEIVLSMRAPAL